MKSMIFSLLFALVCAVAAAPAPALAQPAGADLENIIYLDTRFGRIAIKLRPDLAPKHVKRIKKLTREGFYNGIKFHRVIEGFMAQTGDPTGTGTGSSDYPDVVAEFSQVPFKRGTVGGARSSQPNTFNSQFFIMFAENPSLNGQYTVFGEVLAGMEHVDRLNKGEPPAFPDTIMKIQVAADAKDHSVLKGTGG